MYLFKQGLHARTPLDSGVKLKCQTGKTTEINPLSEAVPEITTGLVEISGYLIDIHILAQQGEKHSGITQVRRNIYCGKGDKTGMGVVVLQAQNISKTTLEHFANTTWSVVTPGLFCCQ